MMPGIEIYQSWETLIQGYKQHLDGAAPTEDPPMMTAEQRITTESLLYLQVRQECFGQEVANLKSEKELPTGSRLAQLDPEYDQTSGLIRMEDDFGEQENSLGT